MTGELAMVLGLLAAAVAMFVLNKPRMDAVALIMLVVLPFTGVLTVNEALAGFSDPNILLIAALFAIGDGLARTGVARRVGDWLVARSGAGDVKITALLMVAVALLGSVMSSTGAVAIFIPIALRVAANTGVAPARMMMPLSVAALISGMLTLVGTAPNLVVNSALHREGVEGFSFFGFTPFGLPVLAAAIVYMTFARHWIPVRDPVRESLPRAGLKELVNRYGLRERGRRLRVLETSPLAGTSLGDWKAPEGVTGAIVSIERQRGGRTQYAAPLGTTQIRGGDILLLVVTSEPDSVDAYFRSQHLEELPIGPEVVAANAQEVGLAEVMVTADSTLVGRTVREARLRDQTGVTVLGLRHGREVADADVADERLRVGDTLLVSGLWENLRNLGGRTRDLLVLELPREAEEVLPGRGRAWHALASLLLMVALMVSGVVSNVHAAFIACLVMVFLRCVDLDSAYRSIHWKSLVLIIGMLPFSLALERTGGVDLAADALASVTGGLGPLAVLASIFAITALLGLFISNTATAVLMAPVALAVAGELGASPYPFAMIVALGASAAFMTPISSPVNTLVVGPGNYTFFDFVRVGVPFAAITLVICVLLVAWLLPVYP
jgi:di/tricarboxylate transporter